MDGSHCYVDKLFEIVCRNSTSSNSGAYPKTLPENQIISQPGCNLKCGNVSIPYPFGVDDPKGHASEWLERVKPKAHI
ncbi:hypothetical protein CR513_13744, partial [Mucuna pruriens]